MTPGTFYVYLAGPLSAMPGQYLAYMARMCQASRELMEAGYCTINPGADLLDGLMSGAPLTVDAYHHRSMELLYLLSKFRRAALYVLSVDHDGGRPSTGVRDEIANAQDWGIRVVYGREELDRLRAELTAQTFVVAPEPPDGPDD